METTIGDEAGLWWNSDLIVSNPNHPLTWRARPMSILKVVSLASLLFLTLGFSSSAQGQSSQPKYYFKVTNIIAEDQSIIPVAKELLEKEISSRSEFTQDLGGAEGEAAAVAEMKRRGLRGYLINLRVMGFKQEEKPPVPGRVDSQMMVKVKLGVYGSTYPGGKIAFTGDGEATVTGEYKERRKDADVAEMTNAAIGAALKQAVSTAVTKMTNTTLPDGPRKKRKPKAK
jgi:hypothetical protein